jgi:histidinol-phosphate aminotransferase
VVHAGADYLQAEFDRMGLECRPSQANFLMVRVPGEARAVFEALLDRGIIVRPLGSYGYPDRLRVSVGRPEENRRFIQALEKVLGVRC